MSIASAPAIGSKLFSFCIIKLFYFFDFNLRDGNILIFLWVLLKYTLHQRDPFQKLDQKEYGQ